MKFQEIKINFLNKIILTKFCRTVFLEFTDIGIQPDRFAKIKFQTDIIQCVKDLVSSGIVGMIFNCCVFQKMIVFPYFSPNAQRLFLSVCENDLTGFSRFGRSSIQWQ